VPLPAEKIEKLLNINKRDAPLVEIEHSVSISYLYASQSKGNP